MYHDPVRDSRKVTDFDVEAWRPGIRELYERAMAADAVAETILAFQGGGGSWEAAFDLGDRALSALEEAGETRCLRVFLRFLWRWADILGIRPEFRCAACGRDGADDPLWYSLHEGGFLCAACAGVSGPEAGGPLPLSPAGRRWLAASSGDRVQPPEGAGLRELCAALTGMTAHALGRRLGTWDALEDIFREPLPR
jgi:DNA repair protein RecO (recombination protein O)